MYYMYFNIRMKILLFNTCLEKKMDDSGGVLTIPMQPMQPPQGFQTFQRPNARTFQRRGPPSDAKGGAQDGDTSTGPVMFDGKRMRKAVHRKTVDYNSAVVQYLEVHLYKA